MVWWSRQLERLSTWASRSSESQLVKFTRINPVHPFERRASGVYVLNRTFTNHLKTAFWVLVASCAYFGSLSTDFSNFVRLDSVFFPSLGCIVALYVIWRNVWPHTVVLNYPAFRYEYYIGERIVSVGPIVDFYVKLKVLFAGEDDMFYLIVVGATNLPEIEVTKLTRHGDLFRKVAKRLAQTLNVNYFDIMDLSHLHDCRHITQRHVDTVSRKSPNLQRVLQQEIKLEYLTHRIDPFKKCGVSSLELCEEPVQQPNWPFVNPATPMLPIPVDRVRRLRDEKRKKETFKWRMRQVPVRLADWKLKAKIAVVGKSPDDVLSIIARRHAEQRENQERASLSKAQEEEELDEDEKKDLINMYDSTEATSRWRQKIRPYTTFRTDCCRKDMPLSVNQTVMMRLVARYMAMRNQLRRTNKEVPGISEDLSFMGMFTAHKDYDRFYKAATERLSGRVKGGCCGGGKKKDQQVHPAV